MADARNIPLADESVQCVVTSPPYWGLRSYLSAGVFEGIVWHHPDGRMVKIKAKDFGLRRKP